LKIFETVKSIKTWKKHKKREEGIVRNERGMEEAVRWLKCQHKVYCVGRSSVEGTPERGLDPTAAYRLGVDIGEPSRGEIPLSGKIQERSQPLLGEARNKW
jgi:hypothetical protein